MAASKSRVTMARRIMTDGAADPRALNPPVISWPPDYGRSASGCVALHRQRVVALQAVPSPCHWLSHRRRCREADSPSFVEWTCADEMHESRTLCLRVEPAAIP